jgi:hypothetical protein
MDTSHFVREATVSGAAFSETRFFPEDKTVSVEMTVSCGDEREQTKATANTKAIATALRLAEHLSSQNHREVRDGFEVSAVVCLAVVRCLLLHAWSQVAHCRVTGCR